MGWSIRIRVAGAIAVLSASCSSKSSTSSVDRTPDARAGNDSATPANDSGNNDSGNPSDSGSVNDAGADGVAPRVDGMACTPGAPKQLPAAGVLAWTGSGWGLAWTALANGAREVFFATLDASGTPIGNSQQVTTEPAGFDAQFPPTKLVHGLAWVNGRYALLFSRDIPGASNELFYVTLTAAGAKEGAELKLNDYSGSGLGLARLEWTGAELGIVWLEGGVRFQRRAPNGQAITQPLAVASGDPDAGIVGLTHPAVAAGNGYGIAWRAAIAGNDEIFFARISSTGEKLGNNVRVTTAPAPSLRPVIAWNGNGFGIAWEDQRFGASNHELFFIQIDASGAVQGTELRVTDDPSIANGQRLVWTGSEYGLVWADPRTGNGEVYLARINGTNSSKIGTEIRVTNSGTDSAPLGFFFVDGAYRVAWSETPRGSGDPVGWLGTVCP